MTARTTMLALLAIPVAACARGPNGPAGPDGDPGPPGTTAAAPRVDAVTPPVGSLRNVLLVTGTNFSAVAGENDVRFGGSYGVVLEATSTALTVALPEDLDEGYAPLTVTRGQRTSAAVGFTVVPSGTDVGGLDAIPVLPGEPAELADGTVLVPDAARGQVLSIAADGTVSVLARGGGLVAPARLLPAPDGSVLAFDEGAGGILAIDPADGAVRVHVWGVGYRAGTFDAAGNLYALHPSGESVDRIGVDGTFTADWCTLVAGAGAVDVQVIGTDLFVGLDGALPGLVGCTTTAAGAATVVAGPFTAVRSVAVEGAEVLAAGIFTETNGQEGVVRITADGMTITAVTTDAAGEGRYGEIAGAVRRQGGEYLITDAVTGGVLELDAGAITVLAGAAGPDAFLLQVGEVLHASRGNGAFLPGWIVRLSADGTSRVLAHGTGFAQLAPGADATTLLAVRPEEGDVVSVAVADGTVTPLFAVTGSAPTGLARDASGNHYVSDPVDGAVARYDAAGVLLANPWVSVAGASGMRIDGTVLEILQPASGEAARANVLNATVTPWVVPAAGVVAPSATLRDSDPSTTRIVLADRGGNRLYVVDGEGFVSDFTDSVDAPGGLAQRADGMILVSAADGVRLVTP